MNRDTLQELKDESEQLSKQADARARETLLTLLLLPLALLIGFVIAQSRTIAFALFVPAALYVLWNYQKSQDVQRRAKDAKRQLKVQTEAADLSLRISGGNNQH